MRVADISLRERRSRSATPNNQREKARLTSWLFERRKLGENYPVIKSSIVEEVKRRRSLEVQKRADRLLLCISSMTSNNIAGTFVRPPFGKETDQIQRMLASAECVAMRELEYLVGYLVRRGWVEDAVGFMNMNLEYQLSVEGHARLAELDQTVAESSKAFVAMWFDDSMDEVWENAIKPGIEDAGYEAIRIDRKEHVNKIDDEIIAELRRARFVVADFTQGDGGPRGGVYYEAGFAHGRDVPVIFSCREDVIKDVHFDTRQYNHILWEAKKLDEFRDRLKTRICAVIGDGPRVT